MSVSFEIVLNSDPPVVAGGDSLAVVTAMAVMQWQDGAREMELQVAGLVKGAATEHWSWLERKLVVGDRITIAVIQTDSPTPPDGIKRDGPESRERHERTYYERLRRKFGDTQ
jgi:hypothetical protein